MTALLINGASGQPQTQRRLQRVSIGSAGSHDEKWLQRLLFENADLIPLGTIHPFAGHVIPLCRELSIPKEGGTVFLDILGVTSQGRLVLIECKLWRNPQARREVVAQILEYASLLRRWTYADLSARLKALGPSDAMNPLFAQVRQSCSDLNEAAFVDAVSRSLAMGDFDLIIAGDGIRSDLQAMADHLNGLPGLTSRLALLEIQTWADVDGHTVVLPVVPFRTEVIQHRVLLDSSDRPVIAVPIDEESDPAYVMPFGNRREQGNQNRSFWQSFIDEARFDHADQAPPRHGGNNWVRLPFPPPIDWVTAYRGKTDIGLFFRLKDDDGRDLFERLRAQEHDLKEEIGCEAYFEVESNEPFQSKIGVKTQRATDELSEDHKQISWLKQTANRFVSAFRLRV